ncbi:MAG: hypothetical protein AAGJ37_13765 [Pseudomonadota bacterium]
MDASSNEVLLSRLMQSANQVTVDKAELLEAAVSSGEIGSELSLIQKVTTSDTFHVVSSALTNTSIQFTQSGDSGNQTPTPSPDPSPTPSEPASESSGGGMMSMFMIVCLFITYQLRRMRYRGRCIF